MPYSVRPCHILSYHAILRHHIIPFHVLSCRAMSYHAGLCFTSHTLSYDAVLCHIMSITQPSPPSAGGQDRLYHLQPRPGHPRHCRWYLLLSTGLFILLIFNNLLPGEKNMTKSTFVIFNIYFYSLYTHWKINMKHSSDICAYYA